MAYQSVNPYDGQVIQTFEDFSDEQVEHALQQAEQCFGDWKRASFDHRAKVLHAAADSLRTRFDEFARPVTLEMGKLIKESRAEVQLSADILDFYAENGERFLAPKTRRHEHSRSPDLQHDLAAQVTRKHQVERALRLVERDDLLNGQVQLATVEPPGHVRQPRVVPAHDVVRHDVTPGRCTDTAPGRSTILPPSLSAAT